MRKEIEDLLERYMKAFEFAHIGNIADCYHVPCMTIRADGSVHLFENRDRIIKFFSDVVETYRNEGMINCPYSNLKIRMMGKRSALITVHWHMQRADSSNRREWNQSYNVISLDGTCVFLVSTFHI